MEKGGKGISNGVPLSGYRAGDDEKGIGYRGGGICGRLFIRLSQQQGDGSIDRKSVV